MPGQADGTIRRGGGDAELALRAARRIGEYLTTHPGADPVTIQGEPAGDDALTVPREAAVLPARILGLPASGESVNITPEAAELTTQQAAEFLNVSRVIVTRNLKHFPAPDLDQWDIEADSPDAFVLDQVSIKGRVAAGCVRQIADSRVNPPESVDDVLSQLERDGLVESAGTQISPQTALEASEPLCPARSIGPSAPACLTTSSSRHCRHKSWQPVDRWTCDIRRYARA